MVSPGTSKRDLHPSVGRVGLLGYYLPLNRFRSFRASWTFKRRVVECKIGGRMHVAVARRWSALRRSIVRYWIVLNEWEQLGLIALAILSLMVWALNYAFDHTVFFP